ncbi:MAG TPA: hypothetical protein VFQ53_07640 [Kofleriaceae bacterium]|nr:hypothetical protein [Kofleriaceae bacterium]
MTWEPEEPTCKMQRDELLGLVHASRGVEVQEPTSVMSAVSLEDLLRQDPELARIANGTPATPMPAVQPPITPSEPEVRVAAGTGTALPPPRRWPVIVVSCIVTLGAGVMLGMLM